MFIYVSQLRRSSSASSSASESPRKGQCSLEEVELMLNCVLLLVICFKLVELLLVEYPSLGPAQTNLNMLLLFFILEIFLIKLLYK